MSIFEKYIRQSVRFYLRYSPLELRYASASFSQFGEDLVLSTFLKQNRGFYIDVGAYHPFNFSNTYLFYKRGWSGINIEPNPYGFDLLRKYRKRDQTLQLAISDTPGNVRFLDDRTYSRILNKDDDVVKNKRVIEIEAKPLRDVLDASLSSSTKIDFLSTDCEGHDLNVLRSNDWEKYRPTYVVTEDSQSISNSEIATFMHSIAYIPICRLGMSRMFVEQDSINQA